jgi:hypothetical protein
MLCDEINDFKFRSWQFVSDVSDLVFHQPRFPRFLTSQRRSFFLKAMFCQHSFFPLVFTNSIVEVTKTKNAEVHNEIQCFNESRISLPGMHR